MKKMILMSALLLTLAIPNYFFGYKQVCHLEYGSSYDYGSGSHYKPTYQPISLKEQAISKLGKTVSEEKLAELKVSVSPELFEPAFKKALLQAATSQPNIWNAVDKIKELAATFHEEEILNEPELTKELIFALAKKYKIDRIKYGLEYFNSDKNEDEITELAKIELARKPTPITIDFSDSYWVAEVLDTPGADQWLEDHSLEFVKIHRNNPFLNKNKSQYKSRTSGETLTETE